eukprot:766608-Amorphochlora_amoeboformis.AAC.1
MALESHRSQGDLLGSRKHLAPAGVENSCQQIAPNCSVNQTRLQHAYYIHEPSRRGNVGSSLCYYPRNQCAIGGRVDPLT